MRRLFLISAMALLTLSIGAVMVSAQDTAPTTCSTFINQALSALSNNCGDLSRNTACYGFNNLTATFMQPLAPDAFAHPNDRVNLADLQSITTAPLDPAISQWGIAVLKAQANLPDALPGQAVTFLLLGDVTLKTGVETGSDQKPMQAVYFTTGIGQTKCSDAPDPSLIIQGPKDITVNLRVNGADIKFGSTLLFQSDENSTMYCGVLDGHAVVGQDGQIIPAGFGARVPLDNTLNTSGDWGGNQPLPDQQTTALQALKDLPNGVLNYIPDVPTPQEVALMGSLDQSYITTLDPQELRSVIRLMMADGITPEIASTWSDATLQKYIADHADAVRSPPPKKRPSRRIAKGHPMRLELISHVPQTLVYQTPILFLHGAWHGAWCWEEYFLPYFAQQGFATHAMSLRGHGQSQGKIRGSTIADYVTDLVEVVQALPAPPVIVGHSLGGFIVQKYLEHYDAPAVVLVAPAPNNSGWPFTWRMLQRDPLAMLRAVLTLSCYPLVNTIERTHMAFFSPNLPREQLERYFKQIQDESFRAYLDYLMLSLPNTAAIQARATPMLIIGAANDMIFSPEQEAALAQLYSADLTMLPDTAHDIMLDANWQTAADRIIGWWKERNIP